jgi:Holliday junction resolvasome RuvABC endonuclease subunit
MTGHAPGGVLALDLASTVGWAYGAIDDQDPVFGCWRLPHIGGEGARYVAFENELAAAIATLQPARLILEASMTLQALAASSTIEVVRQQITLRGIGYAEAYRATLPISEVDAYTVRLEVLGTGRFPKDTVKGEVVRYCQRRGWRVPDHNAGDACLVWLWHVTKLSGKRPVAGRLFA